MFRILYICTRFLTPESNRLSRINEEEESDHASRCKINEGEESKLGEEVFSSPSQNEEEEVVCNKSHRNLDVFDDCVLASEVSQNKSTRDSKLLSTSDESKEVETNNAHKSHREESTNNSSDPELLSNNCYELEDVEEHEFEYVEVENKIESFEGSIGFAVFRKKN